MPMAVIVCSVIHTLSPVEARVNLDVKVHEEVRELGLLALHTETSNPAPTRASSSWWTMSCCRIHLRRLPASCTRVRG